MVLEFVVALIILSLLADHLLYKGKYRNSTIEWGKSIVIPNPIERYNRLAEKYNAHTIVGRTPIGMTKTQKMNLPPSEDGSSFMLWFKDTVGPTGGWKSLIHKGVINEERLPGVWLWPDQLKIHLKVDPDAIWNPGLILFDIPYTKDVWHHVAGTLNNKNQMVTFYVDGKKYNAKFKVPLNLNPKAPLHFPDPWHVESVSNKGLYMAGLVWSPQVIPDSVIIAHRELMKPKEFMV